ncbi:MAG: S41 family peptidase [Armatimonadetes bacterium]|nr:S41 family peptidase [Armatimonadota bacterium]
MTAPLSGPSPSPNGEAARPRTFLRAALFLSVMAFLFGFAGPGLDAASVRRAKRDGARFVQRALGVKAADAQDTGGPVALTSEAIAVLKRDYSRATVDARKARELTYAAIQGMLSTLNDPFTGFLDPDDWLSMQQTTQGSFEGIGAVLEPYGRDVRVVRPLPGSPAFKVGMKAGDVILSVGTHDHSTGKLVKTTPTLGKGINDVVKLIKGPRGTRVTVTVLRLKAAKPIAFTIVRMHIEPPVVNYWMEDSERKIGRIVLNEFNERADEQLWKAWADLKKQGARALVFDLRYNPGGLLEMAIRIGSRFVDKGAIVIVQEKNGLRHTLESSPQVGKFKGIPIAVLINETSASASEIVAGAIKDHGRGKLIGRHTFGKGLVQTLFPLSDGSALRLTTAKYYTPQGRDINNKYDEEKRPIFGTGGIKPDIEVEQSPDWVDQQFEDKEHDTQLKKALEVLRADLLVAARR